MWNGQQGLNDFGQASSTLHEDGRKLRQNCYDVGTSQTIAKCDEAGPKVVCILSVASACQAKEASCGGGAERTQKHHLKQVPSVL